MKVLFSVCLFNYTVSPPHVNYKFCCAEKGDLQSKTGFTAQRYQDRSGAAEVARRLSSSNWSDLRSLFVPTESNLLLCPETPGQLDSTDWGNASLTLRLKDTQWTGLGTLFTPSGSASRDK